MKDDNYDPSKKYSQFVRGNISMVEEESLTPKTPEIVIDIDFKKTEEELIKLILSKDDLSLISKYKERELEQIKARFAQRLIYASKREVQKIELLLQYLNKLIEYEKAKNRYTSIEAEKALDSARILKELKQTQVDMAKLRRELEDTEDPIGKADREKRIRDILEPSQQSKLPKEPTPEEEQEKNKKAIAQRAEIMKLLLKEQEEIEDKLINYKNDLIAKGCTPEEAARAVEEARQQLAQMGKGNL